MSTINSNPLPELPFYANPCIGATPADTAENLVFATAFMRCATDGLDHDEAQGQQLLLQAAHGAAHHLCMALVEPKTGELQQSRLINVELYADEISALQSDAAKRGIELSEFIGWLVRRNLESAS